VENDELTTGERRALEAFAPLAPPAGFADRVLAARTPVPARRRWPLVVAGLVACAAAAAVVVVVTRDPSQAASGELATTERTTASLGRRAIAVVEANTLLQWRIAGDGAASITQPSGDVFYRVERGGTFVVHTPAGDVRVLGTCFRVEVTPMSKKPLLYGAAGAAIAAAVVITVYEGHVIADTRTAQTELRAGNRAMISPDGRATVGSLDEPVAATLARSLAEDRAATREELLARSVEQRAELVKLRARLAERDERGGDDNNATEPGRKWFDPSPERLKEWVAKCHVRADSPALDEVKPLDAKAASRFGIAPDEIGVVNNLFTELASDWRKLVRALYVEATGDLNGTDVLSIDAMLGEIREKGGGHEHNVVLQKISAERAGLAKPPTDLAKLTPYERLMRVQVEQGNTSEAALAKKLGPERAKAIRGDGWGNRSDWSGCPDDGN
jgi:ferric-dicitrate binding protein FerR (iron transport regulator)